jgi:hypothetical protein
MRKFAACFRDLRAPDLIHHSVTTSCSPKSASGMPRTAISAKPGCEANISSAGPEEQVSEPFAVTEGVRPDYPLGMKISLSASLLAVSLAYAQPASSGSLAESTPTAGAPMFCEMPKASAAKGTPSYPVGGVSAPFVGCHDDKNKVNDAGKVKNVRFKLFVSPDRGARIDYVWNKPNEIQAACKNACIEQEKACKEKYAKGDKVKALHCVAQEKACLGAQKPSTVEFQMGKCGKP